MEITNLQLLIVAMLILYTLAVTYIGYRNRDSKDSEDYFLASRKMPAWLLAITFVASWWGGGSAIDLVDHAYTHGLSSFWIYGVPVLIATSLMYIFAQGIRRVSSITQSQMMELRYNKQTSLMLTIFIVIFMTISATVQVIVVGRFFQSFLGVDYAVGAVCGTLLVLIYSLFGGFRGVVLTDLFQFVFFLFSSIFIFVLVYNQSGGVESLQEYIATTGRTEFLSLTNRLGDNLAYVITFGTSWMIQANVWQRISAASTPASAKKMMTISFFMFIPLYLIVTLTGVFSVLLYDRVPDGGVVSSLILNIDSPIFGALIFVGLCSAVMSTMDSLFNTGALSLTVDIYKRYIAPNRAAKTYVNVGRISTFLIAALSLFLAVNIESVLTVSWIGADFLATGAFVPLVLGFVWRRGTSKAALTTMIFGLLFSTYNLLVALGVNLPVAWDIASAEQAIIGISLSLVLYVTISYLTKPNYAKADTFINKVQIVKLSSRKK